MGGMGRPGFRAYRSTLSLRARQGMAVQSDALRGMPRRCGGLPDGSAGLPRRYPPRNDNGGNLRSGFACLAWPCSASDSRSALQGQHRKLRRSVRLRSLPAQAPLCSAAPYGLTPLLAGFETDTEAKGAVAGAGRAAGVLGGAQARAGVAPGATAPDPGRARCRPRGIRDRSCRVSR